MRGLSLVAASGGHFSSRCAGLSLSRPLLLRSTGSRRAGSVVVAHGTSCSAACGIFPNQGSNPCPLHWQADSQPLRHQGSPQGFQLRWHTSCCALTARDGTTVSPFFGKDATRSPSPHGPSFQGHPLGVPSFGYHLSKKNSCVCHLLMPATITLHLSTILARYWGQRRDVCSDGGGGATNHQTPSCSEREIGTEGGQGNSLCLRGGDR